VAAPGRTAFAITVYRREAPTANANSTLAVTADADGRIPTLESLRLAEPAAEWKTRCP